MKIDKKELINDLTDFYIYLRNNGHSVYSNNLKSIIYSIDNNHHEAFLKVYKSSIILGGAGSLFDIDFRDKIVNKKRDVIFKKLKVYKKSIEKPFWKFW